MLDFIFSIDSAVEQYMNTLSNPVLLDFFYFVTELGGIKFSAIICLLIIYFLWRNNRRIIPYFFIAVFVNEVVVYLLKNFIGRLRPFGALQYGEFDASMPSGHATISILLYGYICYLVMNYYPAGIKRNIAVSGLILLVALIGFSRLSLGVHYLSDVLAGYLLGITVLIFLIRHTAQKRRK